MQRNISKKSDQFSAALEYPADGSARIIRRVVEPETPPLLFSFNSETVFLCKSGDFAIVLERRRPHGWCIRYLVTDITTRGLSRNSFRLSCVIQLSLAQCWRKMYPDIVLSRVPCG